MEIKINEKPVTASGLRFCVEKDGKEIGRAFLYIMNNDLKKEPFGLLEDLFVNEEFRGQGIATELLNRLINKAKEINCYKIVATSRYQNEGVHKLYEKLGFENFGVEFKMYLKK